jgi:hypothetical protein
MKCQRVCLSRSARALPCALQSGLVKVEGLHLRDYRVEENAGHAACTYALMPELTAFLPGGIWPDESLLTLLRAACAGAVLGAERTCTRVAAALLVRAARRLESPQRQVDLRRQLEELEEQVR